MSKIKSAIVIPTYNERPNIEKMVERVLSLSPTSPTPAASTNVEAGRQGASCAPGQVDLELEFELVIVDDNSPDGTGDVAEDLASNDGRLHLIRRPKKLGLGSAYREGFQYVFDNIEADYVFEMDCDFSHDPYAIPLFLEAARKTSADLVIGSRYIRAGAIENWELHRHILSKSANIYLGALLGNTIKDYTSGFRCYRESSLRRINLDEITSEGYAFQIEMSHVFLRNGFSVKEIPITFREREGGVSKMSGNIAQEAFWLALRLSTHKWAARSLPKN